MASESKEYAIDDIETPEQALEVTEMDAALLWDLLEELENEESTNNSNHKEEAAAHNIDEGNTYNDTISDNGQAFLKQINTSSTNYNPAIEEIREACNWYTTEDDMVGGVDYFGCNNMIGDYADYYYNSYNNDVAAASSSSTPDQITYSLWEDVIY